jgi:hypothetical protein
MFVSTGEVGGVGTARQWRQQQQTQVFHLAFPHPLDDGLVQPFLGSNFRLGGRGARIYLGFGREGLGGVFWARRIGFSIRCMASASLCWAFSMAVFYICEDGRELFIPIANSAYENLCLQFHKQHLLNRKK